jgi:amino acid transporter
MSQEGEGQHKLGAFYSTAISGNDILSSALYVSGIAAIFAGVYAPLVLLGVVGVLFLYRTVYREVVEALPVNGGAYNALLNGTSKTIAAIAGVMTALSYIATAVISAKTAVEYLFVFIEKLLVTYDIGLSSAGVARLTVPAIVFLLLAFAILVILGVKDSARVAAAIFSFHVFSLSAFVCAGLYVLLTEGVAIGHENVLATKDIVQSHGGLLKTLFLGFSASLLGVSGFESAANFVEEQKPGVFRKTLRNMTLGVLVFNPAIAYVVLNILPLSRIAAGKDFLLADAALSIGGLFFLGWIAINAFLVLSGAVLTSFIGVSGLVNRMSLDACLPGFLAKENSRGSHPRIVIVFFLLCTSILLLTHGDLLALAGVYTVSFLSVMTFFAGANLVLRKTRRDLKRPYVAPLPFVILAMVTTLAGLLGNLSIDQKNTEYFLTYFIPAIIITLSVIYRADLYATLKKFFWFMPPLRRWFERLSQGTHDEEIHVFIHHPNRLASILDYIRKNETAQQVTLVHCEHGHRNRSDHMRDILRVLKETGFLATIVPKVAYIRDAFGPEVVKRYAAKKNIPLNRIFIGSIHHTHEFDYQDFGGVRIIH